MRGPYKMMYTVYIRYTYIYHIIIIINRRSGITSHTSHGHKTGTRSMQPVRSVPLGGPAPIIYIIYITVYIILYGRYGIYS